MSDGLPEVLAPWDAEQLASLNGFQTAGYFHPFTCPRPHMDLHPAPLQAFPIGWVCPNRTPSGNLCRYRQDWAYLFAADGSWRRYAAALAAAYGSAQDDPSREELARWEAEHQELAARIDADPVLRDGVVRTARELDDPG